LRDRISLLRIRRGRSSSPDQRPPSRHRDGIPNHPCVDSTRKYVKCRVSRDDGRIEAFQIVVVVLGELEFLGIPEDDRLGDESIVEFCLVNSWDRLILECYIAVTSYITVLWGEVRTVGFLIHRLVVVVQLHGRRRGEPPSGECLPVIDGVVVPTTVGESASGDRLWVEDTSFSCSLQ
jgi:hypothetical protein